MRLYQKSELPLFCSNPTTEATGSNFVASIKPTTLVVGTRLICGSNSREKTCDAPSLELHMDLPEHHMPQPVVMNHFIMQPYLGIMAVDPVADQDAVGKIGFLIQE